MFCTECGTANNTETAKYCANCGAQILVKPSQASPSTLALHRRSSAEELGANLASGWKSFKKLGLPARLLIAGVVLALIGVAAYTYRQQIVLFIALGVVIILVVRARGRGDAPAPKGFNGNVLIWRYGTREGFQRDAARLAERGYVVASVVDQQQRVGCLRIVTIGFLALLWKPPSKLLVTYHRKP